MQNTTVITKFMGFLLTLINQTEVSPENISDLGSADIFNLVCLLLGEQGVTLVMSNKQSEAGMECM